MANDVDGQQQAAGTDALALSLQRKLMDQAAALAKLHGGRARHRPTVTPFLSLQRDLQGLAAELADGRHELARTRRNAHRPRRTAHMDPMRIGAVVLLVWLVSIATMAAVDLDLDAAGRFVLAFCVVGTSSMLALVVLRARRWI